MTKVAIVSVTTDQGETAYHAIAGTTHSSGVTPGAALDALTERLPAESGTLVVVQSLQPDRYFGEPERARLASLMAKWEASGRIAEVLTAAEERELEVLVDAEIAAAAQRAADLADEAGL